MYQDQCEQSRHQLTREVTNGNVDLRPAAVATQPEDMHQYGEANQEDQPSRLQDVYVLLPRLVLIAVEHRGSDGAIRPTNEHWMDAGSSMSMVKETDCYQKRRVGFG